VLGINYLDLFVPAEQHDTVLDMMKRVLAGESISGYENTFRSSDGTKSFFVSNMERVIDPAGNPISIIAVAYNDTERRKMMDALEAASLYTRSLIEASLDPLVTISRDGKVTDLNRAPNRWWVFPGSRLSALIFQTILPNRKRPKKPTKVYLSGLCPGLSPCHKV